MPRSVRSTMLLALALGACADAWVAGAPGPGCRVDADCAIGYVCVAEACSAADGGSGTGPTTGEGADAGSESGAAADAGRGTEEGGSAVDAGTGTDAGTGSGAAGTSTVCTPCRDDAQCGGGGNLCIDERAGSFCGLDCAGGQRCPDGTACFSLSNGARNCYPAARTCSGFGGDAGTGTGTATGTGTGTATGTGTGNGTGTGTANCTTDTWGNFGQAFFATSCISCHDARRGKYHASHFSYADVAARSADISRRLQWFVMPPLRSEQARTVSQNDRRRIVKWLECGAPQ